MTHRASLFTWNVARSLAEQTPPSRNRYVDFLRAVSICVVVVGHWLVGMPVVLDGELSSADVLRVVPWTQWLSWAMQVMPVFFFVGGYSNAVSWRSAKRKGLDYGAWAANRMQRLVGPLLPLLIFWTAIAVVMRQLGFEPGLISGASRTALIPVWFLSVYILVTVATPVTHWLYHKFGVVSFWIFVAAAATVDFIAYSYELPGLRWANYGFVWLAIHQLGFIWQDGRLAGPRIALSFALGGLGVLFLLVTVMGYPISMISVPGETFSNSSPPSLALLTLGVFHTGLLLTLEGPARRWLQRLGPWTLTVLVNSRIMTLYLWHLTVMVVLIGIAMKFGGIGLGAEPNSNTWWLFRLLWIVVLSGVLLVFVSMLGRYEQQAARKAPVTLATWRVVIGSVLLSLGLAFMALGGISDEGLIGLRFEVVVPAFIGAFLVLPGNPFLRRGG
jgi:hypothetical protein